MPISELKKGVYWVGAIDWDERNFHGFTTWQGITYNAYLVVDEKIALIDTVKLPFYREMLDNIKEVIDPKKIDYIVSNHGEYDHSSGLVKAVDDLDNAKLICSKNATRSLEKMYHKNWDYNSVSDGDKLSLGKKTLQFHPVPMLHWPDSMVTYLVEDKILFSNDAFGQHIASSLRYDDEIGKKTVIDEAGKYYANIIMPLHKVVLRALEKLSKLELDIIAPSHGLILRSYLKDMLSSYKMWAEGISEKKIVVAYDTMWHSTEKMARAIVDGIISENVEVVMFNLSKTRRSDIAKDILDSKGLVVGSPTLHNAIFPTVAEFLHYFKALKPKNKIGAAFGSYGWKRGIADQIKSYFIDSTINVIDNTIEVQYQPNEEDLKNCFEFGKVIAKKIS